MIWNFSLESGKGLKWMEMVREPCMFSENSIIVANYFSDNLNCIFKESAGLGSPEQHIAC